MKRILLTAGAAAIVMGGMIGVTGRASAAHQRMAMMSIQITSPMGPVSVASNGKITLQVSVHGMTFAPNSIGKAPKAGFGHVHFYIDKIPSGGYSVGTVAASPQNGWAGYFASDMAVFDLKKSAVKVGKGTHLLLVALAENNHVLYKAPAAAIVFTVK